MKLLDRSLLKELIPQFLSNLLILLAIIVISQMVRLSGLLTAFGFSPENIFLPFLYITIPFLPTLIPIAFLLSVMLTVSRLNADGEYVGMLSFGYTIKDLGKPLLGLATVLFAISATSGLFLEAWGRRELERFIYHQTQTEFDNLVHFKLQKGVFVDNFLGHVFYAEEISKDRTEFRNVIMAPSDQEYTGKQESGADFVMTAPKAEIFGSIDDNNLKMILYAGMSYASQPGGKELSTVTFDSAEIDLMRLFRQQMRGTSQWKGDYRSLGAFDLAKFVERRQKKLPERQAEFNRAHYLLHARAANSGVIFAFALLGIFLGLFDPRQGKNYGYAGAILVTILCHVLIASFRWAGEKGHFDPVLAAWLPQGAILAAALLIFWRRYKRPPSESII